MNKLEYVSVGLRKVREGEPPSTPQKVRSARNEKRSVGGRGGGNGTGTLLVARNSVWALSPLTLIKKVDALLEKGREEECLKLIEAQQNVRSRFQKHRLLDTDDCETSERAVS